MKRGVRAVATAVVRYRYFGVGLLAVLIWCIPYFTTGNRIEWGDFSMFAQCYEAIRISITQYGQFPWMNAWVAGGVPLYANPQIGVFSLQTLLALVFGGAVGVKLSLVVYTVVGYAGAYLLLRRVTGAPALVATLLSLAWVFNSFFVSHLPSHYTFIWYMLAPLFIYATLRFDGSYKRGVLLGALFGVMALSQIHNPFFHIILICGAIMIVRLVIGRKNIGRYLKGLSLAFVTFLVLAGHRILYTIQNVLEFPRLLVDPAATIKESILAFILPFSRTRSLSFINPPQTTPFGWGEVTAYAGIGIIISLIICMLYAAYAWKSFSRRPRTALVAFALLALTFGIGLGAVGAFAPYQLVKALPVFGGMRVSSRWFVFTILAILVFIAAAYARMPRKSFARFSTLALVALGTTELFALNLGGQEAVASHKVVVAAKPASSYVFEQNKQFGSTNSFPDGSRIQYNDGDMPHFYREYEATTFNIGTIKANDSLVDVNTRFTPLCGLEDGCTLVRSGNATVASWSPNKIILKRSGNGPITVNFNASSYYVVNGKRDDSIRVSEPYEPFVITDPSDTIVIESKPSPYIHIVSRPTGE